jgi:hypothetical protein
MMSYFIRRDDGRWLHGATATGTEQAKPDVGFESLRAAMCAIDRYRIVCAVYAPAHKSDQFTIFN